MHTQQQSNNGSTVPELPPTHSDSDNTNISVDAVLPAPSSLYADLGEVQPVNLISFAYQIASGMVRVMAQFLLTLHT